MSVVTVATIGAVGSGKSAVLHEIEVALRAVGLTVIQDAGMAHERRQVDVEAELRRIAPSVLLREALPSHIATALGGAYQMPDGREFWIDGPVAQEMARRVMAALIAPDPRQRESA